MSIQFGSQRLYMAVQQLAAGAESIQSRLANAYFQLDPLVSNEDLNFKAQKDFSELAGSLKSPRDSSEIIQQLNNKDAARFASKIVDMFVSVVKVDAVEEFSKAKSTKS